jgi:hypothetical protein
METGHGDEKMETGHADEKMETDLWKEVDLLIVLLDLLLLNLLLIGMDLLLVKKDRLLVMEMDLKKDLSVLVDLLFVYLVGLLDRFLSSMKHLYTEHLVKDGLG